ncbi:RNase A-like domain-containing protein [Paraburkholderia sp. EG304]|uniref:RNase A-like domain-containing protein n=1 Tax=Paraburkholderia sp. EG304 TaxID=3237015 RepID=UPI00397C7217
MSYQQDSGAVRVVLSAPQLAAVLSRQSINRTEMLSNRLWGGLQVVGGVLEMVGAAALCVLPEPTMASKAGCVVFGAHGSDTVSAGVRQVWTGRDTATLIQQGTTKLAEAMKASPDMANNIGLSVDMIVPFGFAGSIKAARVASVTMGRINLQMHEARAVNPGLGGHTILKHVEKDEAWLRERLRREPQKTVVSSFHSLRVAELAISDVMNSNILRIQSWAKSPKNRIPLTLVKKIPGDIGYGITRKTNELTRMNEVTVIPRFQEYNNMPYYILTAHVG